MSKVLALSIAIAPLALFVDAAKSNARYAMFAGVTGDQAVLAGQTESFRVPASEVSSLSVGARIYFNDTGEVTEVVDVQAKPVPQAAASRTTGCDKHVGMSSRC